MRRAPRWKPIALGVACALLAIGGVAFLFFETLPVRGALKTYVELIATANRPDLLDDERVARARGLCSEHYLHSHTLRVAAEGGLVGIPRNVHKNFRAWRHEGKVWICPTNRVGPLYQFVYANGRWRFDGPIGVLRGHGEVVPYDEALDSEQ